MRAASTLALAASAAGAGGFRGAQRLFRRLARLQARRAHEHDGVVHLVVVEPALRLEVFRQDPQLAGVLAVQEAGVAVGLDGPFRAFGHGESIRGEIHNPTMDSPAGLK